MREILHCDMNSFYASAECTVHPEWRGRALAVCGKTEERHGIVLAKSEAAKKAGVQTGDTVWQAEEKCPGILIVEPHFELYADLSRRAWNLYREYTDLVEPLGMDECWLDVTASRRLFGEGKSIADHLRRRVKKEMGLTISCGVSYNKVFAKLGSDLKKPDATTVIRPEDLESRVYPLPVGMLFGVGRKTEAELRRFGVATVGALAAVDELFLSMKFGKNGLWLKRAAAGLDDTPVLPDTAEPPMKSIGRGRTFPRDLENAGEVRRAILALSQEIGRKLRFHHKTARGVEIILKDRDFFIKEYRRRLPVPTDCTAVIAESACSLFFQEYPFCRPLRSVTVRAVDLERAEAVQLSLFQERRDLQNARIDKVMDSIRARYGKGAIFQAALLQDPWWNGAVEPPPAFQAPFSANG